MDQKTYIKDGAELYLNSVGVLEAPCCLLIPMTMMLMTTVRVDWHDDWSRSHWGTSTSHAADVLDGRVGLRAIVDRRGGGSHL